jgi:hypothetical protein
VARTSLSTASMYVPFGFGFFVIKLGISANFDALLV